MAAELTAQVSGATGSSGVQATLLEAAANSTPSSPVFPGQFAAVNRVAHRWLFTDDAQGQVGGGSVTDAGRQLDPADPGRFRSTGADQPAGSGDRERIWRSASRPVASGRAVVRPWVSVGVAVLAVVFALLTLAASRPARQNVCRAGGFGTAGRCGRLGRYRDRSRLRRRCAEPDHRQHPRSPM